MIKEIPDATRHAFVVAQGVFSRPLNGLRRFNEGASPGFVANFPRRAFWPRTRAMARCFFFRRRVAPLRRLPRQGRAAPAGLGLDGAPTRYAGASGARRVYALHRLQTAGLRWGCSAAQPPEMGSPLGGGREGWRGGRGRSSEARARPRPMRQTGAGGGSCCSFGRLRPWTKPCAGGTRAHWPGCEARRGSGRALRARRLARSAWANAAQHRSVFAAGPGRQT